MPIDEDTRETYAAYARVEDDWSETAGHRYLERPTISDLLPDVSGSRVLDAGCGTGVNAAWLEELGADVIGVDATEAAVERARDRCSSDARFVVADLSDPLDFLDDASVDVVLCQRVLGHVREWRPVFAEFYSVLRPGAVFVFSVGHPVSGWVTPEEAEDYFAVEQLSDQWGEETVHTYRRPLGEHLRPLLEAGFRIEAFREPTPEEGFKEEHPERYERLTSVPRWEYVRARKPE
jgi:SAM-dependent methyltransferase